MVAAVIKHCDKYKEDKVYLDSQVRVTGRCDEAAAVEELVTLRVVRKPRQGDRWALVLSQLSPFDTV